MAFVKYTFERGDWVVSLTRGYRGTAAFVMGFDVGAGGYTLDLGDREVTEQPSDFLVACEQDGLHAELMAEWQGRHEKKRARAPKVGDVWRHQDGRHRVRVADVSRSALTCDLIDGFNGRIIVCSGEFAVVYRFDAEATAKADAFAEVQRLIDAEIAKAILPAEFIPVDRPKAMEFRRAPWVFDMDDGRGPLTNEARKQIADREARVSASRCPRCAGPAYTGLQHVECLRRGGCRTAEERVADEEARVGPCVIARVGQRGTFAGEPYWQALVDGASTYHPTRDAAVLAWREAAIAAERAR